MRDYEQTNSERGNSKTYTIKEAADMRASSLRSALAEKHREEKNKKRIEEYGNSGPFRQLGSDDRYNGNVYNNTGTTKSEIKSYESGYFINGEIRVLAKLEKLTPEECEEIGYLEYSKLGISLEKLNLLKNNTSYMAGYMTAMLTDNNNKHR